MHLTDILRRTLHFMLPSRGAGVVKTVSLCEVFPCYHTIELQIRWNFSDNSATGFLVSLEKLTFMSVYQSWEWEGVTGVTYCFWLWFDSSYMHIS